ncbi:alpha/beta hydrolase [Mycolicibacterium mengxianglii]|uniref:alpha/beta hydrolase n=1 Tax=Mycolicibacterium mengxianglii TaxID=2736649 RepID=UPI001E4A711F|nr:alpha/beta fold hydrolase [Mycolicibacterium mengxianglii]
MTPRVVLVDGVPMSGLIAEAPDPAAVVVALHGGATTGAYFDCPDHPRLSLLRIGAALGFTVIALDRPGFGSSALYGGEFDDTPRRIDMAYRAVEALLGDRARGAGIFLLAHSNGSELALRMAADQRGPARRRRGTTAPAPTTARAAPRGIVPGWRLPAPCGPRPADEPRYPRSRCPAGSVRIKSGPVSPEYEGTLVAHWQRDFPSLAAQVTVPVRFSLGEHERVWENGSAALAEVGDLFSAAPRVALHEQSGAGHNLSLGYAATAYHLSALSFVEECVIARSTTEFTVEAS